MTCRGDLEVVDQPASVGFRLCRSCFGSTPQRHGREDGDRDVQDVRQHTRQGRPLRQDSRGTRPQGEAGSQTHRCSPGTRAFRRRRIPRLRGQLLDPGAADGHTDPQGDAAEDSSQNESGSGVGPESEQRRTGDRDYRRGEHDRASTQSIGQRAAEQQGRHNSDDVGEEEEVDHHRRIAVIESVHHQQWREFVAAPGRGEHAGGNGQPQPFSGGATFTAWTTFGCGPSVYRLGAHHRVPSKPRPCTWRMCVRTAVLYPSASPVSTRSVSAVWSARMRDSWPGSREIDRAVIRRCLSRRLA
jgi:hypothetical protein